MRQTFFCFKNILSVLVVHVQGVTNSVDII